MHAACFVEMSGHLETQRNLHKVFAEWRIATLDIVCWRLQNQARRALSLVRKWQRPNWELWLKGFEQRHGQRVRRLCYELWKYELLPPLVSSSDDG